MTFDESFDVKKIIGSIIRIGNESVQVEDYNSVPQKFRLTFATYKIIWLNHAQDLNKIKNMILDLFGARNNEVRIVKCYEEIYKDLDGIFDDDDVEGEIKTGNIIFSISHKEEFRAREIKGQHTFEGKKIKIIKFGDEKVCHGCKEAGHLIKNCPNRNAVCGICGKMGHLTCTYATRTASGVNSQEENQEDDEDFEFNENEDASSQNNNIASSNNEEVNTQANNIIINNGLANNNSNENSKENNDMEENNSSINNNENNDLEENNGSNNNNINNLGLNNSINASQVNTIGDVQKSLFTNDSGNIMNVNTAVILEGSQKYGKRERNDANTSTITDKDDSMNDSNLIGPNTNTDQKGEQTNAESKNLSQISNDENKNKNNANKNEKKKKLKKSKPGSKDDDEDFDLNI
jgi:hypothetical protein